MSVVGVESGAERARRGGDESRRARLLAWLALAGTVALALALRWERLALTEFSADQAWVINRAYDFVKNGDFPFAGILSSIRTAQGPIEIYLLAIPVAISTDPLVTTGFVGLWQTLAIVGTYWLTSKYYGRKVGLVAALLFTVNPWALHHARKIWTPDMLPLFTVLFFAAVYAAVIDRRRYQMAFACMWLAVLFLTHPESIVFAPLLGLVVLIFWRRIGIKPLLLGVALVLLVSAPYLYYESGRDFFSLRTYFGFSASGGAHWGLEPLGLVIAMASGFGFPSILGYSFRGAWSLPDIAVQDAIATFLLFAGVAVCLWRLIAWRRTRGVAADGWEKYLLLLLWLWLPVPISARHTIDMWPHYFMDIYPAQFILIGLGLVRGTEWLARSRRLARLPRWAPAALLVGVLVYVGGSQLYLFRSFVDNTENLGPQRPYGVPLAFEQQALANVRAMLPELGNPAVYFYAYNQRLPLDYLARPDVKLNHVDPPAEVVLPKDAKRGVLVVLGSDDSGVANKKFNFHAEADDGPIVPRLKELGFADLPERAVRGPDGYVYYRYLYLDAQGLAAALARFGPPPQQLTLRNGQRLAGAYLPQTAANGGEVRLSLLWELPPDPAKQNWSDQNVFVHAVDGRGVELAQKDGEIWQYLGWRAGEYMLTSHAVALPAGEGPRLVYLDVGAYERYSREPVPVLDPATGKQTGTAVKLGPIKEAGAVPPAPQVATTFVFGDGLALTGYDLRPSVVDASGNLEVRLRWRAGTKPATDYAVSVQVLDAAGRLVTQHDGPPAKGDYPTSRWSVGEDVVDAHALKLPAGLAPGEYALHVVVYPAGGGERLQVADGEGRAVGDNARLGVVRLGEQTR